MMEMPTVKQDGRFVVITDGMGSEIRVTPLRLQVLLNAILEFSRGASSMWHDE